MNEKYHIRDILEVIMKKENLDFITLQGETYGDGIQKRTYSVPAGMHAFMAFNLIIGYEDGFVRRFNPREMKEILTNTLYNLKLESVETVTLA